MGERYFFLILFVLYAAVLTAGGWLVMQPERRRRWRARLAEGLATTCAHIVSRAFTFRAIAARRRARLRDTMQSGVVKILQHKRAAAIALVLLLLPALLALCLSRHSALDSYADDAEASDPVVVALLRGEQLSPPPPLPPDTFLSSELEILRPQIANASREWALLDSGFRQRLLVVFQLMAGHGYRMVLVEGYRTPERQTQLARLGPQVTGAGAFQSYHQYGLAADSAFYRDGKLVISEKDAWAMEGYRLYGKYAESVGLTWGGRWQMKDLGHVEFRKSAVLARR